MPEQPTPAPSPAAVAPSRPRPRPSSSLDQVGKTYDPRWPDPEDAAELQSAVKKLKSAMERYLASVPSAQRGAT